jgi:ubiquinone/menaquinone biosynthesis C-methylase UbiE
MSVSPSAAGVGYRESVVHFWADRLPPILRAALPPGPLALADFGCGDGPWFHALQAGGYISPERPVYAVDLSEPRLRRVVDAFPYIHPCIASVDDAPSIPSGSLDFVISTMVLEHVEDELGYFRELRRVVRTGGRVYCTTVLKKRWAWYFRHRRDGEPVLDPTHLREYTDDRVVRSLAEAAGFRVQQMSAVPLRFPLIDPIAFKVFRGDPSALVRLRPLQWARHVDVPIPGYFSLECVLDA